MISRYPQPSCASPCYVDHNCACACPANWPVACPKKKCANSAPEKICSYYAEQRDCERVKSMCQKTCGVCDQLKRIADTGYPHA